MNSKKANSHMNEKKGHISLKSITSTLKLIPNSLTLSNVKVILNNDQAHDILFNDNNLFNYMLACNLWEAVLRDTPRNIPDVWFYQFRLSLLNKGLVNTIKDSLDCSQQIIDGNIGHTSDNIFCLYLSYFDLRANKSKALVLEKLRFLKRFSPETSRNIEAHMYDDFFVNEKRLAELDMPQCDFGLMARRTVLEREFIAYAKNELSNLPDPAELDHLCYISGGAINDSQTIEKCPASKVAAIAEKDPMFFHQIGFNNMLTHIRFDDYSTYYTTVPKSYKIRRGIAVESGYRQYRMQGLRLQLFYAAKRLFPDNYPDIDDLQIPNQEAACQGSIDGKLATIDFSSASDNIRYSLVQQIFPRSWTHAFDLWRSKYLCYKNNLILMSKFAAMGSALCFEVERIIFLLAARFATWVCTKDKDLSLVRAYGDDVIIPSYAVDCFFSLCDNLGWIVNTEKSYYGSSCYRESCGKEYWKGFDISSTYFPRTSLEFKEDGSLTPESIMVLVSLQHKIVNWGYSNIMLCNIIRGCYPRITESEIGSIYSDIWSATPNRTLASDELCERWQRDVFKHTALKTSSRVVRDIDMKRSSHLSAIQLNEFYDLYNYEQFLRFGPTDDPLFKFGEATPVTTLTSNRSGGPQAVKLGYVVE